jgi:hypothetical protein
MEKKMARKFIDCRMFPDSSGCTMVMVADNVDELVECAMNHSVHMHKAKDTPEFRNILRQSAHEGVPDEKMPEAQYMTLLAMRNEGMK